MRSASQYKGAGNGVGELHQHLKQDVSPPSQVRNARLVEGDNGDKFLVGTLSYLCPTKSFMIIECYSGFLSISVTEGQDTTFTYDETFLYN